MAENSLKIGGGAGKPRSDHLRVAEQQSARIGEGHRLGATGPVDQPLPSDPFQQLFYGRTR